MGHEKKKPILYFRKKSTYLKNKSFLHICNIFFLLKCLIIVRKQENQNKRKIYLRVISIFTRFLSFIISIFFYNSIHTIFKIHSIRNWKHQLANMCNTSRAFLFHCWRWWNRHRILNTIQVGRQHEWLFI